MAKIELWYPVKPAKINQYFGENLRDYSSIGLSGHNGWDFGVPTGTPVLAAHDGVVTFTGADGAGGETVVIRTNEKFEYKDGEAFFKTIYVHNFPGTYKVKPGDQVKVGQVLVLSDNTGWSTGPHLHFGLKPTAPGEEDWVWDNVEQNNGYRGAIDPKPYWTGYYAGDAKTVTATLIALLSALKSLLALSKK